MDSASNARGLHLIDYYVLEERVTALALLGAETVELLGTDLNIHKAETDQGFVCLQANWDEFILSRNENRGGSFNGNCDELDYPTD